MYDRLQLLKQNVEPELEQRLRSQDQVTVFTAPSGFAYDLFEPLENIAHRAPALMKKVKLIAADLDPHGVLAPELSTRAAKLGIQFEFRQGNLSEAQFRNECAAKGPFDLALFVGLLELVPQTGHTPTPALAKENLEINRQTGHRLYPHPPAITPGWYVGYQAHYYSPQRYRMLLDTAGFDGLNAANNQSGRDSINHIMLASPVLDPANSPDPTVAIKSTIWSKISR